MNVAEAHVRKSRFAIMAWVLLFALFSWTGFDSSNVLAISPPWLPPGPLKHITHVLPQLHDSWQATLLLLLPWVIVFLSGVELWRSTKWWRVALIWLLYVNVMNTGWLSSSGGQQLMANVLFWCAFLAARDERLKAIGFWAIRLQLLLAYAATGLHKLTGAHWLDGTALGIAATDPAYGPAWIASFPTIAAIATYAVLLFQLTFPIAVWFRATRLPWMAFGVLFHLATAIWMDIPEMGLAFIACYAIWLDEDQLARLPVLRRLNGRA